MASATTAAQARWLAERGCDAVIAQGREAGGHRGMFLTDDIASQAGTFALVPQVADAVGVPVIAAGGIGRATTWGTPLHENVGAGVATPRPPRLRVNHTGRDLARGERGGRGEERSRPAILWLRPCRAVIILSYLCAAASRR
jgi:hypothetical protein